MIMVCIPVISCLRSNHLLLTLLVYIVDRGFVLESKPFPVSCLPSFMVVYAPEAFFFSFHFPSFSELIDETIFENNSYEKNAFCQLRRFEICP